MHQTQRNWHVLKHMQSEEERWWNLKIPSFKHANVKWFEEEAIKHGIMVWFPRQEVGEKRQQTRAAWLRAWPASLRQELDRLYRGCYRPYTVEVMRQAEDKQAGIHYDKSDGRDQALLLLDRQGVLVVLKVLGEENELQWVSTYRPFSPQKRLPTDKRWRKLVRSLKEAALF
jgi:hypothetical protein